MSQHRFFDLSLKISKFHYWFSTINLWYKDVNKCLILTDIRAYTECDGSCCWCRVSHIRVWQVLSILVGPVVNGDSLFVSITVSSEENDFIVRDLHQTVDKASIRQVRSTAPSVRDRVVDFSGSVMQHSTWKSIEISDQENYLISLITTATR